MVNAFASHRLGGEFLLLGSDLRGARPRAKRNLGRSSSHCSLLYVQYPKEKRASENGIRRAGVRIVRIGGGGFWSRRVAVSGRVNVMPEVVENYDRMQSLVDIMTIGDNHTMTHNFVGSVYGGLHFISLPQLAGAMMLSLTVGGFMMMGASAVWREMEPWIFSYSNMGYVEHDEDSSGGGRINELYGVDVSGSAYFQREMVQQAAAFAAKAHEGQIRKTRKAYVTHCIETALIVEKLLSPNEEDERAEAAVVAALLHDAIDDADVDPEVLYETFGNQVGSMVTKVSQLSATNQLVRRKLRLEAAEHSQKEIDKLRAMIVTMVSEPLVIVIKLADRLHNMRTVYALAPEKQVAVAKETQRVWCSLAERLGMFAIKSELEDLCFAVLQPTTYAALRADLDEMWGLESIQSLKVEEEMTQDYALDDARSWLGCSEALLSGAELYDDVLTDEDDPEAVFLDRSQIEVRNLIQTVLPFDASTFNMEKLRMTSSARKGLEVLQRCAKALLQEITMEGVGTGLEISVQGRVKSLYSSFKKMVRKSIPLSEVYDVRALRVVVDDCKGQCETEAIEACYKVLPTVHRMWRRVPGEDDDYISLPKASGYQSLHTAIVGPGGVPMEVQIRTSTMHEEAEYGKAAHWSYKEMPKIGYLGDDVSPESISPGHPVLRISPNGKLTDAVVISSEREGKRLLVAKSHAHKTLDSKGPIAARKEIYDELFEYVSSRGYFTASQGDMRTTLELFTLCSDGKYHQLDRFGHKLPTTAVPLKPIEEKLSFATNYVEESASARSDEETKFMNNRIKLLRLMIEWGIDVEIGTNDTMDSINLDEDDDDISLSQMLSVQNDFQQRDIMVLVWPSGKIMRLPQGSTAGSLVQQNEDNPAGGAPGIASTSYLINVNNKLVDKSTILKDGDFVVLTNEAVCL